MDHLLIDSCDNAGLFLDLQESANTGRTRFRGKFQEVLPACDRAGLALLAHLQKSVVRHGFHRSGNEADSQSHDYLREEDGPETRAASVDDEGSEGERTPDDDRDLAPPVVREVSRRDLERENREREGGLKDKNIPQR